MLILHVSKHNCYKVVERKVLGAIPAVVTAPLLQSLLGEERHAQDIVLISTTVQDFVGFPLVGLLPLSLWFKLTVRR